MGCTLQIFLDKSSRLSYYRCVGNDKQTKRNGRPKMFDQQKVLLAMLAMIILGICIAVAVVS